MPLALMVHGVPVCVLNTDHGLVKNPFLLRAKRGAWAMLQHKAELLQNKPRTDRQRQKQQGQQCKGVRNLINSLKHRYCSVTFWVLLYSGRSFFRFSRAKISHVVPRQTLCSGHCCRFFAAVAHMRRLAGGSPGTGIADSFLWIWLDPLCYVLDWITEWRHLQKLKK